MMAIIDKGSAKRDDPIYSSGSMVHFAPPLRRSAKATPNNMDGTESSSVGETDQPNLAPDHQDPVIGLEQAVLQRIGPQTPQEEDQGEALAAKKMMVGRAVQNLQMQMRASGKPLGEVTPAQILAMTDEGEIKDSPAVQRLRDLLKD